MPVVLLAALVFLYYIMHTVQPEAIEYKITTRGIYMAKKVTEWNLLTRFSFSKRQDDEILTIETVVFPGRIEFVIPGESKEQIRKALSSYILEEEIPPSGLDKVTNWFAQKLPGNK